MRTPAFSYILRFFLLPALTLLAACGGGGGGDDGGETTTYTVAATAGTGGSIAPASRAVDEGATTTFTVMPASGFEINSVSGCGGSLSGNTYTTAAIIEDCDVTASFTAAATFTVTATAGTGGSIDPASRTVTQGATTTFTITSNSGFAVNTVNGCGGSLSGNIYTTAAINEACAVSATFTAVPTFTVTATAGTGGSIAPASRTVDEGATTTFTVTPASGFEINSVSGCGGSLSGNTYTTAAISGPCSVTAGFSEIQNPPPESETGLDSRPSNTSCVAPDRPTPGDGGYRVERVFAGLGNLPAPLYMGQPPGDNSRWFVAGRLGQILSFENTPNVTSTTAVLTLNIANPPEEGGLLGFAFDPDFASNGQAYVSYTRNVNSGGVALQSVVSRFTSTNGGITLNSGTEQEILVINHPFSNHNGGGIHFGPDGFLYLGMGDGGSIRDPLDNGQNTRNLLGTFVRIDVSGGEAGYDIPSDNPFAANPKCVLGSGAADCPEIFAWGLRNPFRWSFDRATGRLWAGDVGNLLREEVNIIERGGNYGWKVREGMICLDPNDNFGILDECDDAGMIDPIVDYETGAVGRSVIGGYVYRGESLPELQGRYIFGDAYNSSIWLLQENDSGPNSLVDLVPGTGLFIAAFAESHDGELFIVNLSGTLNQLVADSSGGNNTIPDLLSDTGCMNPANVTQPASGLIPYRPGAPFWSDGADKERWLALPNGTTITIGNDDKNFIFPNGAVLVKNFRRNNQLIETRLLMRHPDGIWAGYTYRWNEAQSDATRIVGGATLPAGGANWIYPSEAQCLQCHTEAASRALGLEIAQLNNSLTYPQTGRTANQLATIDAINLLSPPLPGTPDTLPTLPDPFGSAPLTDRARAYLHTNCAGCHQPGTPLQSTMDLRYDTPLSNTNACNAEPTTGSSLGIANARLIAIGANGGEADRSLIPARMNRRDANAMPPIGSLQVDTSGVNLIRDWIDSLNSCN